MKSVGVIGRGRFGKLLETLLSPTFNVISYDRQFDHDDKRKLALAQDTLFIATPINGFEALITEIADQLKKNALIIDVCSVKVHPVKIMLQKLPQHIDILATHPLFGPDSYQSGERVNIVLCNIRDQAKRYQQWKDFFQQKNLNVVELSPEDHDKMMAKSQSLTHLLGRALHEIHASSTGIDTSGYQQLLKIMRHTCNDSWDLFYDLQCYNPYASQQNHQLLLALQSLISQIEQRSKQKNLL